jgi:hypothetical protein
MQSSFRLHTEWQLLGPVSVQLLQHLLNISSLQQSIGRTFCSICLISKVEENGYHP